MSRFTLADGATQKDIGRAVLKATTEAYEARQKNDGGPLTVEQIERLSKQFEPIFEKLFPGKDVQVVFDEAKRGHVIIPYFDPKAGGNGDAGTPFDLTDLLEDCLGNIVFAGCAG